MLFIKFNDVGVLEPYTAALVKLVPVLVVFKYTVLLYTLTVEPVEKYIPAAAK